jgi:uncharacterized small protein (DUF1192 family)
MPIFDEEPPRPKATAHTVGEDLSKLSEDELADRVEILRNEIARIEAALAEKRAVRAAAATFFKN